MIFHDTFGNQFRFAFPSVRFEYSRNMRSHEGMIPCIRSSNDCIFVKRIAGVKRTGSAFGSEISETHWNPSNELEFVKQIHGNCQRTNEFVRIDKKVKLNELLVKQTHNSSNKLPRPSNKYFHSSNKNTFVKQIIKFVKQKIVRNQRTNEFVKQIYCPSNKPGIRQTKSNEIVRGDSVWVDSSNKFD